MYRYEQIGAAPAAWIAAARARESERPDRLFHDPWAHLLAGDTGWAMLEASERASGGENALLPVRTRFFDDVVLAAAHWTSQVVLLGAGLDTRAYRLELPPRLDVYEIDRPDSFTAKEAVLTAADAWPACARRTVEADLRADWRSPLLDAGFDPAAPTVWVAEGLLFYLGSAAVDELLSQAAALSEARALMVADFFGTGLLRLPSMRFLVEQCELTGWPLPFCTDDPVALLDRHGWRPCAITEPGQSDANFDRLPALPDDWSGGDDPTTRTYLAVASNGPAVRPPD
ncbi:SAM-dependent methyltransferase [Planosporangium thailandense]|uniref:S-adenosyl-L-methionine-dependent methyltransferase n=1 Tax=Planosporangium thailandense TaxID=765197 RepID=A0ABX0Y1F0_9ACTN|nr:SAM-dependent methyltransferase [Planosporangium thailandense]